MSIYEEFRRLLNKRVRIQTEDSVKVVIVADITESVIRGAELTTGEPVIFQISNIAFIEYL
ncbi:hypothetical protein [Desulfolucanica intricata]|uniref:hypothetical protein n=1 Tax=Desulfolucanica intricata TaxID=1285191 RepID=UPI00082D054E|nr:hypothetical protein [Desulfolucanica intricata]